MTIIEAAIQRGADELLRSHKLTFNGFTSIQCAERNLSVEPFQEEGWVDIGLVDGVSPSKNYELLELASGVPETSKGAVIVGLDYELGITFSNPTLQGFDLANASNYAYTASVATTVGLPLVIAAGSTFDKLVVEDVGVDLIKPNDCLLVDIGYQNDYTNFKVMCWVSSVDETNHYVYISRISVLPVIKAEVDRIAGHGTGSEEGASATPLNSGITVYEGGTELPRYEFRIVTLSITNQAFIITHIKEGEVRNPVPWDRKTGKELSTMGFTIKSIPQYQDIVLKSGLTQTSTPVLCTTTILPLETV